MQTDDSEINAFTHGVITDCSTISVVATLADSHICMQWWRHETAAYMQYAIHTLLFMLSGVWKQCC